MQNTHNLCIQLTETIHNDFNFVDYGCQTVRLYYYQSDGHPMTMLQNETVLFILFLLSQDPPNSGRCKCYPCYSGTSCDIECTDHGTCEDEVCQCQEGYTGNTGTIGTDGNITCVLDDHYVFLCFNIEFTSGILSYFVSQCIFLHSLFM